MGLVTYKLEKRVSDGSLGGVTDVFVLSIRVRDRSWDVQES